MQGTDTTPLLAEAQPSIQMANSALRGAPSGLHSTSAGAAAKPSPDTQLQHTLSPEAEEGADSKSTSSDGFVTGYAQQTSAPKASKVQRGSPDCMDKLLPYDMFASQPIVPATCIGKCSTVLVFVTLLTIVLVQMIVAYSTDQYMRTDSSTRDISGADCSAVIGFSCESAVCYVAFQGPKTQASNLHLLTSKKAGFNRAAAGSVLTIAGVAGFSETVNLHVCAGVAGEAIDVSGGTVLNLPSEASSAVAAFPGVPGLQQAFHVFAAEGGAGLVRYAASTGGGDFNDDDSKKVGFTQLVPTALVPFGSTAPGAAAPPGVAAWRGGVGASCWEGPAGAPQEATPNCTVQEATLAAPPRYEPPRRTAAGVQPALLQGGASVLYVTAAGSPVFLGDVSVYAWYVLSQKSAGMVVTSEGTAGGGNDERDNFGAGPYDVLFSPEQLLLAAGVPPSPIVNVFGRGFSQVSPTQAIFAVTRCGGDPDGVAANGSWPGGVWQGDPNIPYVHASVEFLLVTVSPRAIVPGVDNADWADWALNSSSPVALHSVRRLGSAASYLTRSQFGMPTQPPHGCPAATTAFAAFPADDFPKDSGDFHHYFVVSIPSSASVGPQYGPLASETQQAPQALPAVVYDIKVVTGILQFRKLASAVGHFQAQGGLGWAAVPSYVCSSAGHIHSHTATLGSCNELQIPADAADTHGSTSQVPTVTAALAIQIDLGTLHTTRMTAIPHAKVLSQALSVNNNTLVFANSASSGDLYAAVSPFCGATDCSVNDDADTITPQGLPRVLHQPTVIHQHPASQHAHVRAVRSLASDVSQTQPLQLAGSGAKHNFRQSSFGGVPQRAESTLEFNYDTGTVLSAAEVTLPLRGLSALSHFSHKGSGLAELCEGGRPSPHLLLMPGMGAMWAQQVLLQCSAASLPGVGGSYGPFTTATDSAHSTYPGSSNVLLAMTAPALSAWSRQGSNGDSSTALLVGLTGSGLEIETHIGTLGAPDHSSIYPLKLQDVPQFFGLQGVLASSLGVYSSVPTEVGLGGRLPGEGTPFMGLSGVASTFAVSNTTYQTKFPYFQYPPRMMQRWLYSQPLVMSTDQLPCGSAPPRVTSYGSHANIASFLQASYPCVRFNAQAQYTISMQYLTHDMFSIAASVGGLSTSIISAAGVLVWYIKTRAARRRARALRDKTQAKGAASATTATQ